MLKRLWLVIAACWALLMMGIGVSNESGLGSWGFGVWLIALGPLAVPLLLRWLSKYVIFGERPGRAAQPYRRP